MNSGTIRNVGTPDSSTGRRSKSTTSTWNSRSQRELTVNQLSGKLGADHLDQDGNATTFHVHGGGLVISRMVNEFGIAEKVAAAIQEAFAARPAS